MHTASQKGCDELPMTPTRSAIPFAIAPASSTRVRLAKNTAYSGRSRHLSRTAAVSPSQVHLCSPLPSHALTGHVRRHVTELPDPALRRWSSKPAKTFNDILPSGYIATAQSCIESESPTSDLFSSGKLVQAAIPKMQGVVEVVRRRTTMRRPARGMMRSESVSVMDEKKRLLEDDSWEVVRKEDYGMADGGRIVRSKSEMRPSRYYSRK